MNDPTPNMPRMSNGQIQYWHTPSVSTAYAAYYQPHMLEREQVMLNNHRPVYASRDRAVALTPTQTNEVAMRGMRPGFLPFWRNHATSFVETRPLDPVQDAPQPPPPELHHKRVYVPQPPGPIALTSVCPSCGVVHRQRGADWQNVLIIGLLLFIALRK
jgi:hypothetical protein